MAIDCIMYRQLEKLTRGFLCEKTNTVAIYSNFGDNYNCRLDTTRDCDGVTENDHSLHCRIVALRGENY